MPFFPGEHGSQESCHPNARWYGLVELVPIEWSYHFTANKNFAINSIVGAAFGGTLITI